MTIEHMKSAHLTQAVPQKMLASLDKMEKELVVIHLGNYLENNQTFRKREQLEAVSGWSACKGPADHCGEYRKAEGALKNRSYFILYLNVLA